MAIVTDQENNSTLGRVGQKAAALAGQQAATNNSSTKSASTSGKKYSNFLTASI